MRTNTASAADLYLGGFRLDASYHSNDGNKTLSLLRRWAALDPKKNRLDSIGYVCIPKGSFIGGRAKRIYVSDPQHGIPFLSSSDMLLVNLDGVKLISKKQPELESLLLRRGWTLISRSGTIGNTAYVRGDMDGLAGSEHIMRVVADPLKISSGYLYAYLSSPYGVSMIKQGTFGAVIDTIAPEYIASLPIPRLDPAQEAYIHQLIEQAADLRVQASQKLRQSQERFYRQVFGIEPQEVNWRCTNEHAFALGTAKFSHPFHRLDGFHHVGYVGEAERLLKKTMHLGELIDSYQPPMFKRPYTGPNGIPFLSGIDLYDYNPKPHMYISRKMDNLNMYIVGNGTILVQNVGQRYGLFGRPTILPAHLDQCAVTQHMMRIFPKSNLDRGFVFIWLSTEVGRRLLLKQSFGTSMGVLFERSFNEMLAPDCEVNLRRSFNPEIQSICEMREQANALEDKAQDCIRELWRGEE